MDSRNEIRLVAEPSRRNNFTAVVHIRDSAAAKGGTTSGCRGRWAEEEAPRKSGAAAGRGSVGTTPSTTAARARFLGTQQPGRRTASRCERQCRSRRQDTGVVPRRAGPAAAGVHGARLIASEGGRLKAGRVSEDRRLHGPMYIRWTAGRTSTASRSSTDGGTGCGELG